MKKIINGKLYNTETAKMIGSWRYSHSGDFNYCEETLYQTKKGNYFVYGEGGPRSRYAVDVGNNSVSGSSNIYVLSFDEAKEWAEENLDADEYLEAFGEDVEEG